LARDNISIVIDMLKAIAEENRFEIIKLLSKKSLCVCEIEVKLKIPQNLVSHHLSVLKKAGLIDDCRCGKKNYYSINDKALNKLTGTLKKIGEDNENISTGIGMCDVQATTRDGKASCAVGKN